MKTHLNLVREVALEALRAVRWLLLTLLRAIASPRKAIRAARADLQGKATRERFRGWCSSVRYLWDSFASAGLPAIAGFVVFTVSMFSFDTFGTALGAGFCTWMVARIAIRSAPLVASLGLPALLLIVFLRDSLPFHVEEPPKPEATALRTSTTEPVTDASPRQEQRHVDQLPPDTTTRTARDTHSSSDTSSVDPQRTLSERLFEHDGSFTITDRSELKRVHGWLSAVHAGHATLLTLRRTLDAMLRMDALLPRDSLHTLGLITRDELRSPRLDDIRSSGPIRTLLLESASSGQREGLLALRELQSERFPDLASIYAHAPPAQDNTPPEFALNLDRIEEDLLLLKVDSNDVRELVALHKAIDTSVQKLRAIESRVDRLHVELRKIVEPRLRRDPAEERAKRVKELDAAWRRPNGPWDRATPETATDFEPTRPPASTPKPRLGRGGRRR